MEQATLNITYSGQHGDLPDTIPYDATDDQILVMAREAIVGGFPGVDAVANPDLSDFQVYRYPAKDDLPNRVVVRPKTAFG